MLPEQAYISPAPKRYGSKDNAPRTKYLNPPSFNTTDLRRFATNMNIARVCSSRQTYAFNKLSADTKTTTDPKIASETKTGISDCLGFALVVLSWIKGSKAKPRRLKSEKPSAERASEASEGLWNGIEPYTRIRISYDNQINKLIIQTPIAGLIVEYLIPKTNNTIILIPKITQCKLSAFFKSQKQESNLSFRVMSPTTYH